ncbi:MAG: 4-hydroxy-tetrahydrodipicolinate reductase [Cyclobacteriaceae bacterium]
MRILLLGYGKMGKTIEKIALERGHEIIGRIDDTSEPKEEYTRENTDVAIEFSQPDAAVENIKWCLNRQIPVVSGTTGWLESWDEIVSLCRKTNGTFFYASNYSIGMNLFVQLNRYLARLMDGFPSYDVSMEEIHHIEKKDAPSGSAITLAKEILAKLSRKKEWSKDENSGDDIVPIRSVREPDVPGTHTVTYFNDEDMIEVTHTAKSRQGFARGAVLVAEWIPGRKGPLGMNDFLNF